MGWPRHRAPSGTREVDGEGVVLESSKFQVPNFKFHGRRDRLLAPLALGFSFHPFLPFLFLLCEVVIARVSMSGGETPPTLAAGTAALHWLRAVRSWSAVRMLKRST